MRSKGSRFTLGVWGLRVCSLDVAFTVATVREPRSSAKVVTFGGFQCRVASFRVGGVALRDSPTCFITCWQSILCGGRNTFAPFQEDELHFSRQAQHFGDLHRHFAWQAQHFRRVALRVFCESHCQGCVKWRQGANCMVGVVFCEMWWKLTEASHETSIFR